MSQNAPSPIQPHQPTHGFRAEEIALGILAILSIAGIGVADFSSKDGLQYWFVMVPIFAAVSIFTGWSRARSQGETTFGILGRQALHWSALVLAIYLVYLLQQTGRLNRDDAGLVALLCLAITTFLAGVHFDWRLGVLGLVLGAAAACAALVEEFFWLLLIPALLAGAVVVLWRKYVA